MATHSSILAWEIPWTEEPGRLECMGLPSGTWLSNWAHIQSLIIHLDLYSSYVLSSIKYGDRGVQSNPIYHQPSLTKGVSRVGSRAATPCVLLCSETVHSGAEPHPAFGHCPSLAALGSAVWPGSVQSDLSGRKSAPRSLCFLPLGTLEAELGHTHISNETEAAGP